MAYIVPYGEKYGYLGNCHGGRMRHDAANCEYPDGAMGMMDFYNARYDRGKYADIIRSSGFNVEICRLKFVGGLA